MTPVRPAPHVISAGQGQRIGSGTIHPVGRYRHIVAEASQRSAASGPFVTGPN